MSRVQRRSAYALRGSSGTGESESESESESEGEGEGEGEGEAWRGSRVEGRGSSGMMGR